MEETEEWKKQMNFAIEGILKQEEVEKEISYLIYCVQQYSRKGGKEDLW